MSVSAGTVGGTLQRRSFASNLVALGVVQYSGYLLSFVTLPILTRSLEPAAYGRLSIALALIGYANLVVEFGFNFSATRRIAMAGADLDNRRAVLWDVFYSRVALMAIGGAGILLLGWLLFERTGVYELLLLSLPALLAAALNTTWYFQGLENVARSAWPNIVPRLAAVPLLILYVRSPADVGMAALVLGLAPLLAAAINLYQLQRLGELQFHPPNRLRMIAVLGESWPLFLSNAAITLYTSTNVLALGALVSEAAAAFYTAADKVIRLFHMLISPLTQAVFPHATRLLNEPGPQGAALVRKLLAIQGLIGMVFSVAVLTCAPWIVHLLFGDEFRQAVPVLRILALLPIVTSLSHVCGIQVMIPLGHSAPFGSIVAIAAGVNLVLLIPMTLWLSETGTALTSIVTELFVTVAMMLFVASRYPHFLRSGLA